MTKDAERILEEARKLSPDERAEIAEILLVTLDDNWRREIEAAWNAEIGQRLAQADAGELESTDWRIVLDQAQKEVLGH
jgi:hypothetical protein